MHSRPFPENSARTTCLFQQIHSDLKEFAVQSYHKHKYYISFLDDNSSHSWISLLKKKSDSKAASKQFIAMVKTQYNATIGEWMTDNGGEYINKDYVKLLKDEGIEILQSVPSQPQINGRAECFNRTIDEKAESMCHQACLPDSWWEFSVLHVNYLYNRTPVRRLDWQTLKGYLDEFKPDLSHLRILGCGAYVFIHKDLRANKLSPKSELMTFLGYHDGHESNMMFMRAPNNIIFTAATALFDECLFPKCAKHKVPPVTQIQEPEEPKISIETESVPDEDAPFTPPHDSIIPQGDEEDCMMMLSLNVCLNCRHSNPDMLQGEQNMVMSHLDALSEKGKVPEKMGTYTHPAPLQTLTDVENCLMQIAQCPFLIQDSRATLLRVTLVMLNQQRKGEHCGNICFQRQYRTTMNYQI